MREVAISANNITIGYQKRQRKEGMQAIHSNLSFTLYAGELTCLLGANGAGKSTLLRTITRVQPPLDGEIFLRNKHISKYTEQEISMLLGLVLTDKTAVGGLTVSELISLGRYPYTGFFGKLSKVDHKIVDQAMHDVCIAHKAKSYIAELSDGERQKVMIAKALAQECPIIILDEPTAFLDVINRIEIMNLLHHLAVTQNKTILLSTHDIELALLLADRLWLLSKNKGLITGNTEDIVLSNAINEYISDSNVSFDNQSGKFQTKEKPNNTVYLQADKELYYWTKNFLSRKGFQASADANLNFKVFVKSSNEINITFDSENLTFKSFDDFDNWMQSKRINY